MATNTERFFLIREVIRESVKDFVKSSRVADAYAEELVDGFICTSEDLRVVSYRLSFCVQLHKHSQSKRIWGADFVEALYDLNDKFEYEKQMLLGA